MGWNRKKQPFRVSFCIDNDAAPQGFSTRCKTFDTYENAKTEAAKLKSKTFIDSVMIHEAIDTMKSWKWKRLSA